jgi:hypothetical protein
LRFQYFLRIKIDHNFVGEKGARGHQKIDKRKIRPVRGGADAATLSISKAINNPGRHTLVIHM